MILLIATAVLADTWDLKPTLNSTFKSQWEVTVDVTDESAQAHHATFDLVEAGKDGDASKGQPVHLEIANVMVETNPQSGASVDGIADEHNVLKSTSDDDSNRRMFAPLLFLYPPKPVSVGDSWEYGAASENKPKMTYKFTAKQVDQVNGADALQVTSIVKEDGADGVTADGTWWVDKSGKVVKFKIDAKKWLVVPANNQQMDAVLTGKLKS